ncbi:MAG TPA: phosphopantetheine-binding protein [Pseudomonadales bacterium]
MDNAKTNELIQALKLLIIEECDKEDEITLDEFTDDMPLFGNKSALALDSLDALQVSMAIQQRYGVRIEGSSLARKVMQSVSTLANYISEQQAANG